MDMRCQSHFNAQFVGGLLMIYVDLRVKYKYMLSLAQMSL